MPEGINWKLKNTKTRHYWSVTSDPYIYLGQLLIDFDFEFGKSIGERTKEFDLTEDQIQFLLTGVQERLEDLIRRIETNPHGITSIMKSYNGKDYQLFVKMSRNHRLVNSLIEFYDLLQEVQSEGSTLSVGCGKP